MILHMHICIFRGGTHDSKNVLIFLRFTSLALMFNLFGYTLTERLGKGTYGEVFKAINQVDQSSKFQHS